MKDGRNEGQKEETRAGRKEIREEGWKDERKEGWKDGRMEGRQGGRKKSRMEGWIVPIFTLEQFLFYPSIVAVFTLVQLLYLPQYSYCIYPSIGAVFTLVKLLYLPQIIYLMSTIAPSLLQYIESFPHLSYFNPYFSIYQVIGRGLEVVGNGLQREMGVRRVERQGRGGGLGGQEKI